MNMQLVYTVNLVLILNCVTIIAKNETESEKEKLDTKFKLNQRIFAEGLTDEPKRRIFGRKGVNINSNETTSDEPVKTQIDNIHDVSSQSSIISSTSVPTTVHKNSDPIANSSSVVINTINQPDNKTLQNNSIISTNISTSSVPNTPTNSSNTSTSPSVSKKLVISTTVKPTEKTTTTTRKPKKPEITFSADDDPQIRDSEKNINYNVANEKSDELPKVEQDIDRTMIEEKRARNSYMLYLGLVFALPTSFVVINVVYRRIKSYLELRHYTRVDFLVDGMYVS